MEWTVAAVAVCCVGLLYGEYRDHLLTKAVFKVCASTAFVGLAWQLGALETRYGQVLWAGLILSWFGDVFLLWRKRQIFLAGLVSFLLGHVAYCGAFAVRGLEATWVVAALVAVAVSAWGVGRWLLPKVEPSMKRPVIAYIVVISAMVTFAFGTAGAALELLIPLGALAFYFSDLAVARDRFVQRSFVNRAWGLPTYYAAQVILAMTVS